VESPVITPKDLAAAGQVPNRCGCQHAFNRGCVCQGLRKEENITAGMDAFLF